MPWVGSHSDQDYFQWNGFGCFHKLRKWDNGIQGMKPWYTVYHGFSLKILVKKPKSSGTFLGHFLIIFWTAVALIKIGSRIKSNHLKLNLSKSLIHTIDKSFSIVKL